MDFFVNCSERRGLIYLNETRLSFARGRIEMGGYDMYKDLLAKMTLEEKAQMVTGA